MSEVLGSEESIRAFTLIHAVASVATATAVRSGRAQLEAILRGLYDESPVALPDGNLLKPDLYTGSGYVVRPSLHRDGKGWGAVDAVDAAPFALLSLTDRDIYAMRSIDGRDSPPLFIATAMDLTPKHGGALSRSLARVADVITETYDESFIEAAMRGEHIAGAVLPLINTVVQIPDSPGPRSGPEDVIVHGDIL